MPRRAVILFLLILGAGLLLAGPAPASGPPAPGEPAHPFTLPDLDDRPVALSSFKDRLVLLHFWATWCPTCREEMTILEEGARAHPETLVILLTAYSTVDTAVEAMKLGAYHYANKPFNLDEIALLVEKALETRWRPHMESCPSRSPS